MTSSRPPHYVGRCSSEERNNERVNLMAAIVEAFRVKIDELGEKVLSLDENGLSTEFTQLLIGKIANSRAAFKRGAERRECQVEVFLDEKITPSFSCYFSVKLAETNLNS